MKTRLLHLGMVWLTVCVFGLDYARYQPQGHVSDFARVIDPASRVELERFCARVKEATGAEIALVTLPSLEGEPIEDAANTLYRKWGIGAKESNEGVLLLLAIRERSSRLEVGYGLEPVLPDGLAGSVLRQMRPALRDGHYGDALIEAAHMIAARIAEGKNVRLDAPGPAPQRRREPEPLPWGAVLGALVLLLFLMGMGRRRAYRGGWQGFLAGMILGNLMGRRGGWGAYHGGFGGGGFGGYDSGDSFGGFGGGDSGGGGASSGW